MSLPERRVLTMGAVHPPQAAPPANACQCIGERSAPLTDPVLSRLAHLYLCEELSTYHIAELTGLDRQKVTRQLRRAGVPLRHPDPDPRRLGAPGPAGALSRCALGSLQPRWAIGAGRRPQARHLP